MIMRSGASALCARTVEPGLTGCDNKPGAVPPHYTLVKSLNYGLIAWESEPSVRVKYVKSTPVCSVGYGTVLTSCPGLHRPAKVGRGGRPHLGRAGGRPGWQDLHKACSREELISSIGSPARAAECPAFTKHWFYHSSLITITTASITSATYISPQLESSINSWKASKSIMGDTVLYNTVQYCIIQYNTVQCSTRLTTNRQARNGNNSNWKSMRLISIFTAWVWRLTTHAGLRSNNKSEKQWRTCC